MPDVVFSGGEIVSSPNPPTVHTVMGSSAELQQPGLTNTLYQENWNAINRSRCIFLLIMEQNRIDGIDVARFDQKECADDASEVR